METPSSVKPTVEEKIPETDNSFLELKKLFLDDNVVITEHFKQQTEKYFEYVAVLLLLLNQGAELSKSSKSRILGACWARNDQLLANYLLTKYEIFGLPQVLGAISLLDAKRKIREVEKRIERIQKHPKVKPSTLGALRNQITNLSKETLPEGSVTGSLARSLKRWARTVSKDDLEFYALQMPKDLWKGLADITHLNPKDFAVPWFLDFCFGKKPPEDSIVGILDKELSVDNIIEILKSGVKVPYSWLRSKFKPIPEAAKPLAALYTPLSTLIWWFDEVTCPQVDELILKRLEQGEDPGLPFGKLMERLLYFRDLCYHSSKGPKPASGATVEDMQVSMKVRTGIYRALLAPAEVRLQSLKQRKKEEKESNNNSNVKKSKSEKEQPGQLAIEGPIAVLGDASGSMEVAIRVSTVISALFSAICNAELKFFNGKPITPPFVPKNAEQVVELTTKMKAEGMTAPAAGLWDFFAKKEIVKTIIVVSDEAETSSYMGLSFARLYQRYHQQVYPAKVVIFSFAKNNEKGIMTAALENMGFKPSVFKFDGNRPDLTKLDGIMGILSSEAKYFSSHALEISKILSTEKDRRSKGYKEAFEKAISISHDPVAALQIPAQGEEEAELEHLKKQLAARISNSNNNDNSFTQMVYKPVNTDEVDLVFAIDCTGSMGSYIQSAKDKIIEIMKAVGTILKVVRFAVIAWRDHPPQDTSYITKVYPFTDSIKKAQEYVNELQASGGGDTPEAVADGVYEASKLNWKQDILKIVIFVADAPPHGLPNNSDQKPKGWDTHDPIAIAHNMAKEQITIYSVGCEPQLSSSPWGSEFFKALAEIGGGRYISLSNASILPDIIIGGVTEELELEKVSADIVKYAKEVASASFHGSIPTLETDQLIFFAEVCRKLSDAKILVSKLEVDNICEGLSEDSHSIASCKTFAEAVQFMTNAKYERQKTTASSEQAAATKKVEVEPEQVKRVLKKKGMIQD